MADNKHTFLELIRYLFNFIFRRKKLEKERRKKQFKKVSEGLKEDYEEIDKKKESKKNENVVLVSFVILIVPGPRVFCV